MSEIKFNDPKLAIIFAYAPAGLGHLRVTDALRHGLPLDAQAILLPSRGESIRFLHRLTSVNPTLQRLMEWAQHGRPEALVTRFYRRLLLSDAGDMEEQLFEIYKQRIEVPSVLLVVASHFGIAHQVGKIKKHLEKRIGIPVVLVVQVTDDSPQSIWYVPGADLICVPSEKTKEVLQAYGRNNKLPSVRFEVLPYPVSLHLGEELDRANRRFRQMQMSAEGDVPIHVVIPVSGAAVGTNFAAQLARELRRKSKRFHFHLVVKRSVFTDIFVRSMEQKGYVQTYTSHSDRQIVELYESAYTQSVIGFEVTKPSEQAFKALFCSRQRGGSILLFSEPVGRQEFDNLAFLRRHLLIPTREEQQTLFEMSETGQNISPSQAERLFPRAATWRGVRIQNDPKKASQFIWWCMENGIFGKMHECYNCPRGDEMCKHELGSDGVARFWEQVKKLL